MTKIRNLLLAMLLISTACYAQAAHSVTLSWSWSQGTGPAATGFNIYRATTAAGPFTNIGNVALGTLTFTDSSAAVQTAGSSFVYQVTAFNPTSESTPSNQITAVIPFPLSAPIGLSFSVK